MALHLARIYKKHADYQAYQVTMGQEESFEKQPKIAPEFGSVEEFDAEINDVGYARYNYKELGKREEKLREMIDGATDVALFNSGAAAMHSAIEAEGLKTGDVVLCANAIYGTTKSDIQQLESMGIEVVLFDSTDLESLKKLVEKKKPRLIVAESVANSPKMEMVDLKGLSSLADTTNTSYENLTPDKVLANFIAKRESLKNISDSTQKMALEAMAEYKQGQNPFIFRKTLRQIMVETGLSLPNAIRELERAVRYTSSNSREKLSLIIDNTLPSPQLLNPLAVMKGARTPKVIVESGTKHFQNGANEITMGLAYSDNIEKMRAIKARRIELGTYLQPNDERKIPDSISEMMPETMNKHAQNALHLAQVLSGIKQFEVSHPNLPEHRQNEFAKALAPKGVTTLFYVTVPPETTGKEFMQKIKDMAGDKVGLGSSFGHSKTWLSNYGLDTQTVRIAAGSETSQSLQEILEIFKTVAEQIANRQPERRE